MRVNTCAEEEVVRLYIPMDDVLLVQEFDAFQHLIPDHQGTFQRHYFVVVDEDIFHTRSQQVHQHDIILPFGGHSMDFGQANSRRSGMQVLVHLRLEVELGELGVGFF